MSDPDLLVIVVDGSTELSTEDLAIITRAPRSKHVLAINKCDLAMAPGVPNQLAEALSVKLSALTGEGLEELTAAILTPFGAVDSEAVGLLVTDSRHYDLLRRAQASLERSAELYSRSASEVIVLVGLHNALRFLGEITGETTTDDILSKIFSTFCIGK